MIKIRKFKNSSLMMSPKKKQSHFLVALEDHFLVGRTWGPLFGGSTGGLTMADLHQHTPNDQTKGITVIRLTSLTQWSDAILDRGKEALMGVRLPLENLPCCQNQNFRSQSLRITARRPACTPGLVLGLINRLNVLVRTADRRLVRYDVLMWWMGTGLKRLQ